ncbi:E3 ubiquitin-protein ligase XB3-like [Camellia sinensis]|uniref:E3 ubiquitin-protein ligase XB3-like n=1 Tax=Camellia sinensis TaxID=4442 RepID=UPI001036A03F|nr:E3 ubiquitin-protein ligase XB3-like [Camellia sinensis]
MKPVGIYLFSSKMMLYQTVHRRTINMKNHQARLTKPVCLASWKLTSLRENQVREFARFVNIRDKNGATQLHLAVRQRWPGCVHMLLDSGALVCASSRGYGFPGIISLHFAVCGGSLDCVRELLAWGADRLHRDSSGPDPLTYGVGDFKVFDAEISFEYSIWN